MVADSFDENLNGCAIVPQRQRADGPPATREVARFLMAKFAQRSMVKEIRTVKTNESATLTTPMVVNDK